MSRSISPYSASSHEMSASSNEGHKRHLQMRIFEVLSRMFLKKIDSRAIVSTDIQKIEKISLICSLQRNQSMLSYHDEENLSSILYEKMRLSQLLRLEQASSISTSIMR